MIDIWDSVKEWLKERTTSPLYATFIFSVLLWNWKFFYILFWQDEGKLLIPKIEYIQSYLLDTQGFWHHLILFLILPATSTFLIIWVLPILGNYAHEKSSKFYFQRKEIFDNQNNVYEQNKTEKLKEFKKTTTEQTQVLKEIASESKKQRTIKAKAKNDPTMQKLEWNQEYDNLKNTLGLNVFRIVNELIYQYAGRSTHPAVSKTNMNDIAYADTSGLIELKSGSSYTYQLTEKGKFFLKKYFEEHRRIP